MTILEKAMHGRITEARINKNDWGYELTLTFGLGESSQSRAVLIRAGAEVAEVKEILVRLAINIGQEIKP